jgi:anti-sigma regulatory factor (Ser/Thr protein kinase)
MIGVLIGDVSGKGPAAALLTGYIIGEIKGLLEKPETSWNPEVFLTALSNSIYEQNQYSDFYATAWYGIFDIIKGKVTCSNAGHPSPYLASLDTVNKISDDPAVPLGLLSTNDFVGGFTRKEFYLNPGDRMIIFTDGLTEQRQLEGAFIPEVWLKEALTKLKSYKLNDIPEALIKILNIVSKGAPADDDRLIVAVEMSQNKKIEFSENHQDVINEKIKLVLDDAINNGMPRPLEASLKLGLLEAIYNAFRHGLPSTSKDTKPNITFFLWIQENTFSCSIIDSGAGFNWQEAVKNKSKIKDVDITSEGGRGIPLLFEMFNKVTWNLAGNEIGLTLKW